MADGGIRKLSQSIDFYHSPSCDNFIETTIKVDGSLLTVTFTRTPGPHNNLEKTVKFALSAACAVLIVGTQGVHAQLLAPTPEVTTFLESPTQCSMLVEGVDRAGNGVDRIYAESLNKALSALAGSLLFAVEGMRSACAVRSTQSVSLAKAAS